MPPAFSCASALVRAWASGFAAAPRSSAAQLAEALAAGEATSVELTEAALATTAEIDGAVHAYLHLDRDGALAQAAAADRRRADGAPLSSLDGVPVAVKDVLATEGMPTTCGSRILEGWRPPYDATVTTRLRDAGISDDRFETFVARSVRIGTTSVVGAGSIVLDGTVVTADAALGRHVVVMPNCTITHDDVLGDFSTLAAGVSLGGGVRVGEGAYVGMNASVRQEVRIGEWTTVGMGAVVLDDVPDAQIWAGVPARPLGSMT